MSHERTFLWTITLVWLVLAAQSTAFVAPEFRPYEVMLHGHARFRAGASVEMEEYGALAYRYFTPELRVPRVTRFSTDAAGFRNPPFARAPRVVIAGDSFVVGVGLSDDETIPARLATQLGEPVYNYGAQHQEALPQFVADARFVQSPPALLIFAPSGVISPIRVPEPASAARTPEPAPSALAPLLARWTALGAQVDHAMEVISRDNGLRHLAKTRYLALERALLGFEHVIDVDGAPALVLTLDEQRLTKPIDERELADTVRSLLEYQRILAERGTKLVFAPLPDNGELYANLYPEAQRARLPAQTFPDVLRARAAAAGIPVIDVRPALTRARTPYLFFRDDTHLDVRGAELAARAIAEGLRAIAP
ncbi:hypothetical protein L6R52_32750 [Myxococcota bacterium]|nr:hypothetical protein [Myxococcota bacterium]